MASPRSSLPEIEGSPTAAAAQVAEGSRRSRLFKGRGGTLSALSTIVFFGILFLLLLTAPGTSIVVERFFSPEEILKALPQVASAFLVNVRLMLVAEVVVLVMGLVLAVARGLPGPVAAPARLVAVGYVDLFRGIPLILVLFMVGFGLPGLQLRVLSTQSVFTYGVISLVLVYSAYVAEVYRAGIESVHPSQGAAARSLGLSRWQSLRFVLLPQAVRRVIPPLLNDFIGLQKDTALVSVIGVVESAREAQAFGAANFNYAGYVVAAVLFVLMTIPLARFTDYLVERDRRRWQASAGQ